MEGVVWLGPEMPCGAYVLWIEVKETSGVQFGRFAGGRPQTLDAGSYLYVGSAMGRRGASTLAHRLLRHATRSDGAAHPVRPELCTALGSAKPPAHKRLHWHIDYLLDHAAADLTGIIALRSAQPLEAALADLLTEQPWTAPVAPRLGASDHARATHLLRLDSGDVDRTAHLLRVIHTLPTANDAATFSTEVRNHSREMPMKKE